MSIVKGPLFSLDADGTIGKSLSYSKKSQNNIVSKYSKPGDVSPGESSPRQKDQRSIIKLITIHWQCMDDIDRLTWETAAKAARFKGSGYHYFLHMAQTDLKTYLGLVGYWSMNYETGGKIPDLSGNGNHGTLSPIYPCDSPPLVDSVNKKEGKALYFNGITNYVDLGRPEILNNFTKMSLFFLLNPKPFDGTLGYIFYANYHFSPYGIMCYYHHASNRVVFWFKNTVEIATNIYIYVSPKTWFTIGFTWDNTTIRFYINGKDLGTPRTFSGTLACSAGNIYLSRPSANSSLLGKLDNFIIYNRCLTSLEVSKLFAL